MFKKGVLLMGINQTSKLFGPHQDRKMSQYKYNEAKTRKYMLDIIFFFFFFGFMIYQTVDLIYLYICEKNRDRSAPLVSLAKQS